MSSICDGSRHRGRARLAVVVSGWPRVSETFAINELLALHRAGLLAAVFVVGYLSFSLPAIAAGVAVSAVGLARSAELYGALVIVLALLAVAALLRSRRATAAVSPVPRVETVTTQIPAA